MKGALVLVALAGCDALFQVDHLNSSDASGSGSGSSAMIDAADRDAPMGCTGHDEDGDGVPDACDPCPTNVINGPDVDNDSIGDECDPNINVRNSVLAFFPFIAFEGLVPVNAVVTATVGGSVMFQKGAGSLSSTLSYNAVDEAVIGMVADSLTIASGQVSCALATTACPAQSGSGCLTGTLHGTSEMVSQIPVTVQPGAHVSIELRQSGGSVTCRYVINGVMSLVNIQSAMLGGTTTISGSEGTSVDSLIIYGNQ